MQCILSFHRQAGQHTETGQPWSWGPPQHQACSCRDAQHLQLAKAMSTTWHVQSRQGSCTGGGQVPGVLRERSVKSFSIPSAHDVCISGHRGHPADAACKPCRMHQHSTSKKSSASCKKEQCQHAVESAKVGLAHRSAYASRKGMCMQSTQSMYRKDQETKIMRRGRSPLAAAVAETKNKGRLAL